jgi:hypothetical protein
VTARNRTHLPRREPGCTVDIESACFDRLKLQLERVRVNANFAQVQQARAFLSGSFLERGRGGSSIKARSSALLFKAHILPTDGGDFGTSLTISLDLNLTRFLARNYERLGRPVDLRSLSQAERLSWLTVDEDRAATRSLDNNDNFISDAHVRSGTRLAQAEWLGPYVELVLSFLAGAIELALVRVPDTVRPTTLAPRPALVIPLRNWRMRQLEVFWEFWSPNAVAEASDLVEVAETISYEFNTTRYDLGRLATGFAYGISARSHVDGIRHKTYAKLLNRLRYEISYDRVTTQIEKDLRLSIQPDENDFVAYTFGIARAAAVRADHWLNSVSEAERRSSRALTRSKITSFLDAIYRSAPPAIASLIIGYLVGRGAVPRSRVDPELLTALLKLQRQGYLVASNPGRARHTTTYRAAPPWDHLIAALRSAGEPSSTLDQVRRLDT